MANAMHSTAATKNHVRDLTPGPGSRLGRVVADCQRSALVLACFRDISLEHPRSLHYDHGIYSLGFFLLALDMLS